MNGLSKVSLQTKEQEKQPKMILIPFKRKCKKWLIELRALQSKLAAIQAI
jgi:hypothetical protein